MKWSSGLLTLLTAAFFLYAIGSARLPLLGPDEPRYSQVAREMLESGDFITPTLGGTPWFEKPVLLYWMQDACYALFGVNEWAARFPSILAALFCVWVVASTVRRYSRDEPAFLTGLVAATSLFFIVFAHAATFDMLLTACVAASLCSFLIFEQEGRSKWLWLGYAAAGAGVLAKGFVAPIVIGLTMFLYLVVSGKLGRINQYRPVAGSLLAAAVAAIWILPVTLIHGTRFWDDFFIQHHLMRYTTSHFHRSGGLLYYLPVLLLGCYPWLGALFLKSESFKNATSLRRMAWCWFAGTVAFFSLSQSKLPGYILPAMPAFAILAGLSLYDAMRKRRKVTVLFLFFHTLMVLALIIGSRKIPLPGIEAFALPAIIAALSVAALYLFLKNRPRAALFANAAIPAVAALFAIYIVFPFTSLDETRTLAAAVLPELNDNQKVLLFNDYDFPMVFYTDARVALTSTGYFPPVKTDRDLLIYLKRHNKAYVAIKNQELDWIKRENRFHIESLIEGPRHSIVLLSLK